VAWTATEIRTSLQKAGFSNIRTWDQAPFVHEWKLARGFRTVYLARKARGRKAGAGSGKRESKGRALNGKRFARPDAFSWHLQMARWLTRP